jgi:hypothetical protein
MVGGNALGTTNAEERLRGEGRLRARILVNTRASFPFPQHTPALTHNDRRVDQYADGLVPK